MPTPDSVQNLPYFSKMVDRRLTPASTLVMSSTLIPANGSLSASLEIVRRHDVCRGEWKAPLLSGRNTALATDIVCKNSCPTRPSDYEQNNCF